MKTDKKLEEIREEMIHGVLKDAEFDDSKKSSLLKKINTMEGTSIKKRFSLVKIGLSTAVCLSLFSLLILSSLNNNQMENTPATDDNTNDGVVDQQDREDTTKTDDNILSIDIPDQEPLMVSINDLPILKKYIEGFEDEATEISRIQTRYLTTINKKDYALVNYSCGTKLCNQLLLEHRNGDIKSILVSESSMFQTSKQSEDYLALLFGRNEGSEVIRNQVVIINLKEFKKVPPPEDLLSLDTSEYPITKIELENSTLIATIPDIEDTSYEGIQEWFQNNQEPTRNLRWELESTKEKEILATTRFTDKTGKENAVGLVYDGDILLTVNDSQKVVDANVSEDFLKNENSDFPQSSYSLRTLGEEPFIAVVHDFPMVYGPSTKLDLFSYSDQNIQAIFSTSDMKLELDAIDYENGEVAFTLPSANKTVTYVLTNEEKANTEKRLMEFKENNVKIDEEYIKSIKDGITVQPIEVSFKDMDDDGKEEILIKSYIQSVGARTPVRVNTDAVFVFELFEGGIQWKEITFKKVKS